MELLKNIDTGRFGEVEGDVWFELFGKYIRFSADDSAELDYVKTCSEYLNNLPDSTVDSLCKASIKYCNEFLSDIGEETINFKSSRDVLKLVNPSTLIVPDPENGDEPVVWMELNCEWEVEHGMEWVIRANHVLYVGGFNGTDPWTDIPKDECNYA